MKCISCDFEHQANYCSNCGEYRETKKLSLTSILADALSTITNMDKGFLFNFKTLILNPRIITEDYILGKRRGILNPISFLIISVTIYLIVLSFFRIPKELVEFNDLPISTLEKVSREVGLFIRTNLKYFWILVILPLALTLKLVFRKYNYIENLAISSFIIGQASLIGIISYLIFKFPLIFDPVVYLVIFWLVYKIFRNKDRWESIALSGTALIFFIILLVIIVALIGVVQHFF